MGKLSGVGDDGQVNYPTCFKFMILDVYGIII